MQTYNYDYACALTLDAVNALLASRLSGTTIEVGYEGTDEQTGQPVALRGTLAPWAIAPGGEGKLLRLHLPFTSGTLTGGAGYDLAGVTVGVEVTLTWIGGGSAGAGSDERTQLVFEATQKTDPANPGYVTTGTIVVENEKLGISGRGLLGELIADVLIANRAALQTLLGTIVPRPQGVASWLAPQSWDYFYAQDQQSHGYLCLLCMLGATPPPATPAFDTTVLDGSDDAYLLLAQQPFVEHILLPAIEHAFGGGFAVSSAPELGPYVRATGDVSVGKVVAHELTSAISLAPPGIVTRATGGGPLTFLFGLADLPNASYSWEASSTNQLTFDATSQRVSFAPDPSPSSHATWEIPWYDWVLLATIGITTAPGLASAIYDLVNDFCNSIDVDWAGAATEAITSAFGSSVVNVGALVEWGAGTRFSATGAGLDGAFYVRGALATTTSTTGGQR
jgi:Clostridium P-47 protein